MVAARMTISVGVDVEQVARFDVFERQRGHRFLQHAFLPSEVSSCFARASPAQHLAARWAAKEAVIKALSHCGHRGVHWRNIEIVEERGAPRVRWHGKRASVDIVISLSHSGGLALAGAVAQQAA